MLGEKHIMGRTCGQKFGTWNKWRNLDRYKLRE